MAQRKIWRAGRFATLLALCASGCVSPSAERLMTDAPEVTIARSLGYFKGAKPVQSYSISDPWRALTGETMVCVQRDIPDGKGGFFPAKVYSMYALQNGQITNVNLDEKADCPLLASYHPLPALRDESHQ
jgi:hypothetical protein